MKQDKPLSNWIYYPSLAILSIAAGIALEHFVLAEVITVINLLGVSL